MLKIIVFMLSLAASVSTAFALNLACSLGSKSCIPSQGTKIPSSQAIEMLESCDDFTRNDVGRQVLRMSQQQILDRSNGKAVSPYSLAMYAGDKLYDSPLKYQRMSRMEDTDYNSIKRACNQLQRDFDQWAK
jgi:hypothetical protein